MEVIALLISVIMFVCAMAITHYVQVCAQQLRKINRKIDDWISALED